MSPFAVLFSSSRLSRVLCGSSFNRSEVKFSFSFSKCWDDCFMVSVKHLSSLLGWFLVFCLLLSLMFVSLSSINSERREPTIRRLARPKRTGRCQPPVERCWWWLRFVSVYIFSSSDDEPVQDSAERQWEDCVSPTHLTPDSDGRTDLLRAGSQCQFPQLLWLREEVQRCFVCFVKYLL